MTCVTAIIPKKEVRSNLREQAGQLPFRSVMRKLLRSPLGKILGGKVAQDNVRFNKFGRDALTERKRLELEKKSAPGGRTDLFHFLFGYRDPETGQGYTDESLSAESELLIIAGSDTSSTVLAAVFFYLSRNPRVLRKLTDDLRRSFESVDEIRFSNPKLASHTYLRAALDEAMRMTPPVGAHIPRRVLPGGVTIDGIEIPEGITVGIPTYTVQHNEEYYSSPFTYWPERWIADESTGVTPESIEKARAAFCAFSVGPRGCIGRNLALSELTTAVGRLLWQYDMKAADGNTLGEGASQNEWGRRRKGEFQTQDFFVAKREGPVVQFKHR